MNSLTLRRSSLATIGLSLLHTTTAVAGQLEIDLGRGPLTVHFPDDVSPDRPAGLLVMLHGYTASGSAQEAYFRLQGLAEEEGFVYVYPDGTSNPLGHRFWNATDACCNFFGSSVDDVGYVVSIVEAICERLTIDPWRVHLLGHSNGGFMSYRLACERADVFASLTSLAGATFDNPDDCNPVGPVHVQQVHGTVDATILYPDIGELFGTPYPGAERTAELWADELGCFLTPDESAPARDLDSVLPGDESTQRLYEDGCRPASSARLWTIPGGSHAPAITDDFRYLVLDFARTHPKAGVTFFDDGTLEWPPLHWADEYRIYRGDLAGLVDRDGDGRPDGGYGDCISDVDPDPTDTVLVTEENPPPGVGWFYLVGFRKTDGTDSLLGTSSLGLARYAETACP
ncbi:MAG: PHB depolymerase family esterase [Acidobacteriota bacterium]